MAIGEVLWSEVATVQACAGAPLDCASAAASIGRPAIAAEPQ